MGDEFTPRETIPRIGLLKDTEGYSDEELEEKIKPEEFEHLKDEQPNAKEKWIKNIKAFRDNEEKLISEGYKGQHALFFNGELYAIGENRTKLQEQFFQERGYHIYYISRIGGDIPQ